MCELLPDQSLRAVRDSGNFFSGKIAFHRIPGNEILGAKFEIEQGTPCGRAILLVLVTLQNLLQDTQLLHFFYSAHHDRSIYEDPHIFNPSRHLDQSGKFAPKVSNFFFGLGKRRCIGEALARQEMFLVLASIVQKFKVKVEGPTEDYVPGMVVYPAPCKVTFEMRN